MIEAEYINPEDLASPGKSDLDSSFLHRPDGTPAKDSGNQIISFSKSNFRSKQLYQSCRTMPYNIGRKAKWC